MTPQQQTALETLVGRALTADEVSAIDGWLPARRDDQIAALLSTGRKRVVSRHVTERGVRALAVLPRARFALLDCLRTAANTEPAWLSPTLTALGVPAQDHPAYADDLASAWRWLLSPDGLDIGSPAARSMLDLIAANVTAAAPACAAVKALAEEPAPITVGAVSDALNAAGA